MQIHQPPPNRSPRERRSGAPRSAHRRSLRQLVPRSSPSSAPTVQTGAAVRPPRSAGRSRLRNFLATPAEGALAPVLSTPRPARRQLPGRPSRSRRAQPGAARRWVSVGLWGSCSNASLSVRVFPFLRAEGSTSAGSIWNVNCFVVFESRKDRGQLSWDERYELLNGSCWHDPGGDTAALSRRAGAGSWKQLQIRDQTGWRLAGTPCPAERQPLAKGRGPSF
ncbi:uncharacterized protein LOC128591444 [Nycticebus coucang]|uniref:uncharacterized protein LOC128591444 n=1 Tax=Nycticebus coucang TaxID=9470 RepID=UPI00234DC22B|nr:uncharacterized protein LOC128591444 [Nycticebus coucang]